MKKQYTQIQDGWCEAAMPSNENKRLETLLSYHILNTEATNDFNNLTRLVANVFDAEYALISFIDKDRQWSKSYYGVDLPEVPRNHSFCSHTVLSNKPLIVLNSHEDERFRNNPLVTHYPKLRFYAGVPLITKDACNIGTLWVGSSKKRDAFRTKDVNILKSFGLVVMNLLSLHKENIELQKKAGTEKNKDPLLNNFNAKILIAEDSKVNQMVISAMLQKLNCQAEFADDGQIAIDKAKDTKYDLILMDCYMPNIDGFEATKTLRDNPETKSCPIIALTANTAPSAEQDCLDAGMNDFLMKPMTIEQLNERLAAHLGTN